MILKMTTVQDHYSLRWNNHQNHILRAFDTLLQTKTLVDVTLVCAETSIRAHKMVLSACSPFFQRVFAETPCKHPVIVLKDFRGWVVQAIVDFMYRGEISVPQERLQTLIQAGESLQVRGLVENSVPENTPTPAASPDEFGMMDASLLSSELGGHCSSFDDDSPSMVTSNSKIRLPSNLFATPDQHQHPDLCTSPMPRRKQARPRRRSGECGPHDLTRPPSQPAADDDDKDDYDDIKDEEEKCNNDDDDDEEEELDAEMEENQQKCRTNPDNQTTKPEEEVEEEDQEEEEEDESRLEENHQENDDNADGPENLCTKKPKLDTEPEKSLNNNNNSSSSNNNNNNNNRIVLSLKDIRQLNKPPTIPRNPHMFPPNLNDRREPQMLKHEHMDGQMDTGMDNPFHMDQIDLSMAAAAAAHHHHQNQMNANHLLGHLHHQSQQQGHDRLEEAISRMNKEFAPTSPMNMPPHFNPPDGPPHPPSPLPFPGMPSALGLTPPHMFGLDSPLGLFPPGMDPGKLYNPLMEMSDPRGMPNDHQPFLKKKIPRPKGQHSAPRGGPPRSWTNAELTEALQHVWNKKMTTSQASRIFGIPYNSLLMYVRGKYGKSLKLEQLRKDCISGPPVELLMGMNNNLPGDLNAANNGNNNNCKGGMGGGEGGNRGPKEPRDLGPLGGAQRSSSSEPDLLSNANSLFNPFPPGFYPDFAGSFPGIPLGMLNLLPPERHQPPNMHLHLDEDCKSDRSKQSIEDDFGQSVNLSRDDRPELMQQNGQD